jgi:hypothetical protein
MFEFAHKHLSTKDLCSINYFGISMDMGQKPRATIELIESTVAIYGQYQRRYTARFAINAALIALDRMGSAERDSLVDKLKIENPKKARRSLKSAVAGAVARAKDSQQKQGKRSEES